LELKIAHNLNQIDHVTTYSSDPPPYPSIITKAYSGIFQEHYFKRDDSITLSNYHPTLSGPLVCLPNAKQQGHSSHLGTLQLDAYLSTKARKAHVFDAITNSSLISIGQLCDNNCITVLDKNSINIYKKDA
jgi:hypothetical protein